MKNKVAGLRLLVKSFIAVVRDPTRTDLLFNVISDPRLANPVSYEIVINKLSESPRCLEMIKERYNQDWNLDELLKLPPETLGYIYAKHMKDHNLDVDFYQVLIRPMPEKSAYRPSHSPNITRVYPS